MASPYLLLKKAALVGLASLPLGALPIANAGATNHHSKQKPPIGFAVKHRPTTHLAAKTPSPLAVLTYDVELRQQTDAQWAAGAVYYETSVYAAELQQQAAAQQWALDADYAAALEKATAPAPAPATAYLPVSSGEAAWVNSAATTCIRNHESNDNYSTVGVGGAAGHYGAYQDSMSTWASVGGTGLPSGAPAAVQDALNYQIYQEQGWGAWATAPLCGV